MSFGLGKGRELIVEGVGIEARELPPLPDNPADRTAARLDPRQWFPQPHLPFEVEIGSGKGTFLLQQAAQDPGTNYLGIEWAREFYAYAADRVRRAALPNVRLLHADATEFLRWRMPDGIARVIHLYFSDPWPKSRHHKRRVVQDRFLEDAHRVLIGPSTLPPLPPAGEVPHSEAERRRGLPEVNPSSAGELRIVTDHDEYWQWMQEHFARWAPADGRGPFTLHPFERPASAREGEIVGTNFERKYAREGRPFNAAVLRKAR